MSDRYGFDFNNDGKVSFTESHMTYHIERETAQKGYLSSYLDSRASVRNTSRVSSPTKITENTTKPAEVQPEKKKSYTGLIIFLVIVVIVIGSIIADNAIKQAKLQNAYDNAIELIRNGDYGGARNQLWDLRDKGFSDIKALEKYCSALSEYSQGSYISAQVDLEACIDTIRKHDEFDDPDALMSAILPLADAERAENKRRAEEQERIRQENWRKNGAPYVGMKESEITTTSIGRYSKTGGNYEGSKRCNLYYWFNSKGEQTYSVRCCEGKVIQVWDDRDNPRSFKVKSTKSYYNSSSKSSNKDDEYNVKDYYSAEDFYDDHYDDFFDYYDAEDYYEEHGGF